MVHCPRCDHPVDETARTTCPICSAPLQPTTETSPSAASVVPGVPVQPQGQPVSGVSPLPTVAPLNQPLNQSLNQPLNQPLNQTQSQPRPQPPGSATSNLAGMPGSPGGMPGASSSRGVTTRMTLNGDIIEVPSTPQAPPPGTINAPGRGAAPRTGSPGVGGRRTEAAPARSGGNTAVMVVIVLLVLGLGGFGGWYAWMHRTNPKDQAQKFLTALKNQDYKTMYDLVEQSDTFKQKYKNAQDFEDQMNSSQMGAILKPILANATFEAQPPTSNNGSEATVPVKATITVLGQTQNQNFPMKMKNFGGIWKASADSGSGKSLNPFGGGMSTFGSN